MNTHEVIYRHSAGAFVVLTPSHYKTFSGRQSSLHGLGLFGCCTTTQVKCKSYNFEICLIHSAVVKIIKTHMVLQEKEHGLAFHYSGCIISGRFALQIIMNYRTKSHPSGDKIKIIVGICTVTQNKVY